MIYIITFISHFDAILANRSLLSAGVEVQLIPVPRAVSASCGTCVYFEWPEGAPFPVAALDQVQVERVYRKTGEGWTQVR